ncbi:hypothetical protein BUALT_Bualt06G0016200 [Buddleja alternifolia]|uniref:F-box domain-containing protein n=1 Tax=Buddleja alternifolia TaxID=168488 RepID=A0AAV6XKA7_9LAMI|nr:hypothetical protein BUALT_Bualt06G0016200 [Buddleja alternifolia]
MEDGLSQLPDDVLCLIISRLPTQDAVKTSILSRRWRNLYKFINRVRFHCCNMSGFHSTDYSFQSYAIAAKIYLSVCMETTPFPMYLVNLLKICISSSACPSQLVQYYQTRRAAFEGQRVAKASGVHHSQLKEVEFCSFGGSKNEVEFALYMLKTAAVLERMCISICPFSWTKAVPLWDEEKQNMICKQFQEQALSKNVVVIMQVSRSLVLRPLKQGWRPVSAR